MPDHLIHDKFSALVMNHLMDIDRDPPILFDGKVLRLDDRIKHFELPLPVFPHRCLAQHPAAFHAVRPIHIVTASMQERFQFPAG